MGWPITYSLAAKTSHFLSFPSYFPIISPSSSGWLLFICFWMLTFLMNQSLAILNPHVPYFSLGKSILFQYFDFFLCLGDYHMETSGWSLSLYKSDKILYPSAHMASSNGSFYDISNCVSQWYGHLTWAWFFFSVSQLSKWCLSSPSCSSQKTRNEFQDTLSRIFQTKNNTFLPNTTKLFAVTIIKWNA